MRSSELDPATPRPLGGSIADVSILIDRVRRPFSFAKGLRRANVDAGSATASTMRLRGVAKSIKSGVPDGRFGSETEAAICKFQQWKELKATGVLDQRTLELMDRAMVIKSTPRPIRAPVVLPIPPSDSYKVGTADPVPPYDPGSGPWGVKRAEYTYIALKASMQTLMPAASSAVGPNAAAHLEHFLANSGADYTIDLERMVREVPRAQARFDMELAQAKAFCESLPPGRHSITSIQTGSELNPRRENANWFYATGGYHVWGKGTCVVASGVGGNVYTIEFEHKVFDRYNRDGEKSVPLFGLTIRDEFLQEFHRQGLAREFDCHGSIRRSFAWRAGESMLRGSFGAVGGRS
jgi:peptidoglycan hydrolase-like protein with peptidoglycan-binding domain